MAGSELISAKEVQKVLENKDAAASYSERYESAYCIYAPNAYQTATEIGRASCRERVSSPV